MLDIDDILRIYENRGRVCFGDAILSQHDHAIRCAQLAQAANADDHLVAAALLHDFGHLVHELGDDFLERGIDDAHERRAARLLATVFPPAVVEPIRLHVLAKRYLVTVDTTYRAGLQDLSQQGLRLQGGGMEPAEVTGFEREPFHADAIRLRRWDDRAWDQPRGFPPVRAYRVLLERCRLPVTAEQPRYADVARGLPRQ